MMYKILAKIKVFLFGTEPLTREAEQRQVEKAKIKSFRQVMLEVTIFL